MELRDKIKEILANHHESDYEYGGCAKDWDNDWNKCTCGLKEAVDALIQLVEDERDGGYENGVAETEKKHQAKIKELKDWVGNYQMFLNSNDQDDICDATIEKIDSLFGGKNN